MSYGYLIVSRKSIPELQKHRRFKFTLVKSSGDFYAYARLEESNELTIRAGEKSFITPSGKNFFSSIPEPFFFMDYLLLKKQNEVDIMNAAISNLTRSNFKRISIASAKEFSLNFLYEVHD